MNRRRHRFDQASEQEWNLQERAFVEERAIEKRASAEARGAPEDADTAAYRRIVRALRRPPAERLPSNFAWQVAQLAARLPRPSRLDLRLESWLVRGLVAAMVLGGLAVAGVYGLGWLRALDASGSAGNWLLLVAGCVALTWLPEGWRRWTSLRG